MSGYVRTSEGKSASECYLGVAFINGDSQPGFLAVMSERRISEAASVSEHANNVVFIIYFRRKI
jgi:hypothetical protein